MNQKNEATSEMIIANCGSCPALHENGEFPQSTCQIARRTFGMGEYVKNTPPPKWCPLRRRGITLRLEEET